MCHVTHVNKSCRTCGFVMPRMWIMSHTPLHMSHTPLHITVLMQSKGIGMSLVTHVNESRHTCGLVTSHMWFSRATHLIQSCHTCAWGISRAWMRGVGGVTSVIWTWLSQNTMSHVTYSNYSCHTPLLALLCSCSTNRDRSHVTHVNESDRTCEWAISHIWMSPIIHTNESCCHRYESECRYRMYGTYTFNSRMHILYAHPHNRNDSECRYRM